VVGLVLVLSDLDEDIREQLCEDGEAVVNLEMIPSVRDFLLDILHERFWNHNGVWGAGYSRALCPAVHRGERYPPGQGSCPTS
jgi:hypothetical protein